MTENLQRLEELKKRFNAQETKEAKKLLFKEKLEYRDAANSVRRLNKCNYEWLTNMHSYFLVKGREGAANRIRQELTIYEKTRLSEKSW